MPHRGGFLAKAHYKVPARRGGSFLANLGAAARSVGSFLTGGLRAAVDGVRRFGSAAAEKLGDAAAAVKRGFISLKERFTAPQPTREAAAGAAAEGKRVVNLLEDTRHAEGRRQTLVDDDDYVEL